MRFNILTSSLLIASLGLTACGGDDNNSSSTNNTPSVDNSIPTAPTTNDDVQLNGVVADNNGVAVEGVTLQLADQTVVTDNEGRYTLTIEDGLEDDDAVLLVKKAGYLTTAREISSNSAGNYKLDVTLTADQVATLFESSTGVTQPIKAGASVVIPANSIVNADGSDYNGTVNLNANYYNPDSIEGANAFAQPYAGVDQSGENETPIVTVGVIDVKITDTDGNALDLKEGATATLNFPEASTDQDLATIPLWYYDEADMIWVKDGTATRQPDGSYVGTVTHFTLWNLDIPVLEYSALVQGCFVYEDTNEPIKGGIDAVIKGRGFANSGGVDNEGKFSARVPINTPLTLSPYYSNDSFNTVVIPALEQNSIYNINDGVCINAKDPSSDDVFTYVDVFANLPADPVMVTPNPQPIDPLNPLDPKPVASEAGLIGHSFYFDDRYDNGEDILNDIELSTMRTTTNNTMEFVEQSLYGKSNYDSDSYNETYYTLTTNGLETQSSELVISEDGLLKIEWYSTNFSNNVLAQRLNNGVTYEYRLQDVSIANQKIGDIFALDNAEDELEGSSYVDIPYEVIDGLNALPASLSVFNGNATCKKLTSVSHGSLDYIEFGDYNGENQDFETVSNYFESPMSGTWAGLDWVASSEKDSDDHNYSRAYVKYNDKVYYADYNWAGNVALSNAEKNECVLYNDAAKDQILDALAEAFPAL